MTEIEVFGEIRKAIELKEGARVPMIADVVSGPRTALTGGPPSARELQPGDLLIADLVPRHLGYWGDSCKPCSIGEPNKEHGEAFKGISAVLAQAIEKVRP